MTIIGEATRRSLKHFEFSILKFSGERWQVPELPFYHLQTDGVWEIEDRVELRILRRSKNPLKSELKKFRIAGGFTDDVFRELKRRPELVRELAREILAAHFRVLSASLRDRRDLG